MENTPIGYDLIVLSCLQLDVTRTSRPHLLLLLVMGGSHRVFKVDGSVAKKSRRRRLIS